MALLLDPYRFRDVERTVDDEGADSEASSAGPPIGWLPKYSDDEPRDDHGRWTSDGSWDASPSDMAARVSPDGFTFHPYRGTVPRTGYQVALSGRTAQHDQAIVHDQARLAAAIHDYVEANHDAFTKGGRMYVGGWVSDGKLWLDVSERVSSREDAVRLGRERDQISIWDNENAREIETGGTGGQEPAEQGKYVTAASGHAAGPGQLGSADAGPEARGRERDGRRTAAPAGSHTQALKLGRRRITSSGGTRRDRHLEPILARVRDSLIAVAERHEMRPEAAKYNPDEPRDDHGRWTSDGGSGAEGDAAPVEIGGRTVYRQPEGVLTRWPDLQAAQGDLNAKYKGETVFDVGNGKPIETMAALDAIDQAKQQFPDTRLSVVRIGAMSVLGHDRIAEYDPVSHSITLSPDYFVHGGAGAFWHPTGGFNAGGPLLTPESVVTHEFAHAVWETMKETSYTSGSAGARFFHDFWPSELPRAINLSGYSRITNSPEMSLRYDGPNEAFAEAFADAYSPMAGDDRNNPVAVELRDWLSNNGISKLMAILLGKVTSNLRFVDIALAILREGYDASYLMGYSDGADDNDDDVDESDDTTGDDPAAGQPSDAEDPIPPDDIIEDTPESLADAAEDEESYGPPPAPPDAQASVVDPVVEAQQNYLIAMASDLSAGNMSRAQLDQRLGNYAATINPIYERGFRNGVESRGEIEQATWNADGDKETCELCLDRDGKVWKGDEVATMPYPGDGNFGGDVCLGGPRCRCWIDWTLIPYDVAAIAKAGPEDEARDDHGRWTSDGGATQAGPGERLFAQPRGDAASFSNEFADAYAWQNKTYDGWYNALSADQQAAVDKYKTFNYQVMNGLLRGKVPDAVHVPESWGLRDHPVTQSEIESARVADKQLAMAIERAPGLDQPTIVFRQMSGDGLGSLKTGDTFTDRGFVSTSLLRSVAAAPISIKAPTDVTIHLPAGTRAGSGNGTELVLQAGSTFLVNRLWSGGMDVTLQSGAGLPDFALGDRYRDLGKAATPGENDGRYLWRAGDVIIRSARKYSDDEARDERGRWASDGGDVALSPSLPPDVDSAAHDWSAGASDGIRDAIRYQGEHTQFGDSPDLLEAGRSLVTAINDSDPTDQPLLRGIGFDTRTDDGKRDYIAFRNAIVPGKTIDMNLSSWTADRPFARDFARNAWGTQGLDADPDRQVIFTLEKGAHALDISSVTNELHDPNGEHPYSEWLTAGRFEITTVGGPFSTGESGVSHYEVGLRQTGVLPVESLSHRKLASIEGDPHFLDWLEAHLSHRMVPPPGAPVRRVVSKVGPVDEARDAHGMWTSDGGGEDPSYRGDHTAPGPDSGAPMHDLGRMFPDDVYGPDAVRYYGSGQKQGEEYRADQESAAAIRSARGKPDAQITIYRALPIGHDRINAGDWVTPSRTYANIHLEGPLRGEGHVVSMRVPASTLYWNGDSLAEFGYSPPVTKAGPEDEARDDHGRWTSDGGASDTSDGAANARATWGDHPLVHPPGYQRWGSSHSESQRITGMSATEMGIKGYPTRYTDEQAGKLATTWLRAINNDKSGSGETLYHGFQNVANTQWKVGDTLDLPLTAAAGDRDDASGYGIRLDPADNDGPPTVFQFERGTPMAGYDRWTKSDAADFGHQWSEAIVAGRFSVTGIRTENAMNWRATPYTVVSLRSTATFDPSSGKWVNR